MEHRRPRRPPVALIDWETAGPVDPLVELAQLAWLNAKLHDNTVAEREQLPPVADRARQLAAILDGYGLTARQRRGFLDQIVEFAICDTAGEADDADITSEMTSHPIALWAMAWRARPAAWMIRHRRTLETALTRGAPLENGGEMLYIEQSCYSLNMRLQVPRAKIRAQSPVLAVVLLAILVHGLCGARLAGGPGGLADSAGRAGRVRVLPAGSSLTPALSVVAGARPEAGSLIAVTMEIYIEVPSAATRAALRKLGPEPPVARPFLK